jgi:protocatechuate 3,4-dioxygenase beta subunit
MQKTALSTPPDRVLPDLQRRRTIGGIGLSLAGALAGTNVLAQAAGTCVLTPEVGEGPFYFDPALMRSDIRDGLPGVPIRIRMQVLAEASCVPIADARVDLWQADAVGLYSGYTRQRGTGAVPASTVAGQTWLRGTQRSNGEGEVSFLTLFPSWYVGRTPHIHFKILLGDNEVVASQIFFPEEFNQEILTGWDPYREHAHRQDTRNDNDTFLRGRTGGVFCEVAHADDEARFRGTLTVAVRGA